MNTSTQRLVLVSLSVLVNSCAFVNVPESIKQGELRVEYPQTLPQKCYHLYNVGRSEDWFDCMGVGLK